MAARGLELLSAVSDALSLCDNFLFLETTMKKLLCFIAAAAFLAGCNTVQGIGKDIEKGGEAIQKSVK